MKKLFLLIITLMFITSLTGCFGINRDPRNTSVTTTFATENPVDYSKIQSEIYSNIYEEIKRNIYDELVDDLKKEFINGTIDYDDFQSRLIKTARTASEGNVYVLNKKYNSDNELVAYGSGSGVIFDMTDSAETFSDYESKTFEKAYRYYVITNEHVINSGDGFEVVFSDETMADAYVIGSDEQNDIALLYFDSDNYHPLMKLGDSDDLAIGEVVLAVGNPKGQTLFSSVTMGVVGGVNRNLIDSSGTRNTINKYIQHDAAINAGNSGGGLYNLEGEVVGINSVKYVSTQTTEIEGLNFAIPINLVKDICSEIREYGHYDGTVSFGITVTEVTALTKAGRTNYNVPDDVTDGIVVISVNAGGSSDGALIPNDIIVGADNIVITKSSNLQEVLKAHRMGDTVELTVIRNGERINVNVTFHRTITVSEDENNEGE